MSTDDIRALRDRIKAEIEQAELNQLSVAEMLDDLAEEQRQEADDYEPAI